jgi:hypothetical protein
VNMHLPHLRQASVILLNPTPERNARLAVAAFIAVLSGAFFWGGSSSPVYSSDLDQVWYASRALLRGLDPYSAVGPGTEFDKGFPLYYPLPAIIGFLPLALLPLQAARLAFVTGSAALLAYAITSDGWHRLPIFLSGAYLASLAGVQWSPLLTAAFLLPWLGPVLLFKPNMGLALLLASERRSLALWFMLGGGTLLLVSLAFDPGWVGRWLASVCSAPHFSPPVLYPGGFLVLLALLRWRRPEARLLVAMACVPHTTLAYEALPLLLIAANWKESLLLTALSFVTLFIQFTLDSRVAADDPLALTAFSDWVHSVGTFMVVLLYIPATFIVLRRPNMGGVPALVSLITGRTGSRQAP